MKGGYPETRKAIAEYRGASFENVGRALVKVQEAFLRENPDPPPDVDTMTPSYIEWLIDGGRAILPPR